METPRREPHLREDRFAWDRLWPSPDWRHSFDTHNHTHSHPLFPARFPFRSSRLGDLRKRTE